MFLLNSTIICEQVRKQNGELLKILNFEPSNLRPTYYYFRLGASVQRWDGHAGARRREVLTLGDSLNLESQEYVLVQAVELFWHSAACFAVLGPASRLIEKGLSMRHSPFIDPTFPGNTVGFLDLGLKNELSVPNSITIGDIIGKICFFNVADTYPIPKSDEIQDEYRRRART